VNRGCAHQPERGLDDVAQRAVDIANRPAEHQDCIRPGVLVQEIQERDRSKLHERAVRLGARGDLDALVRAVGHDGDVVTPLLADTRYNPTPFAQEVVRFVDDDEERGIVAHSGQGPRPRGDRRADGKREGGERRIGGSILA
jgi:hypothetical protein